MCKVVVVFVLLLPGALKFPQKECSSFMSFNHTLIPKQQHAVNLADSTKTTVSILESGLSVPKRLLILVRNSFVFVM